MGRKDGVSSMLSLSRRWHRVLFFLLFFLSKKIRASRKAFFSVCVMRLTWKAFFGLTKVNNAWSLPPKKHLFTIKSIDCHDLRKEKAKERLKLSRIKMMSVGTVKYFVKGGPVKS